MQFVHLAVLTLISALAAAGAPLLTLTPGDGAVSAPPGGITGWGFTLTPDANEWVVAIGSFTLLESNPDLGVYADLIGAQGGPINGALPPGAPDWMQSLDLAANTGLGIYFVSPLASVGATNTGTLFVLYETYSADPSTCVDCRTGEGELTAPFQITVDTPVPEPSLGLLSGLVLAGLAWRLRMFNHGQRP